MRIRPIYHCFITIIIFHLQNLNYLNLIILFIFQTSNFGISGFGKSGFGILEFGILAFGILGFGILEFGILEFGILAFGILDISYSGYWNSGKRLREKVYSGNWLSGNRTVTSHDIFCAFQVIGLT